LIRSARGFVFCTKDYDCRWIGLVDFSVRSHTSFLVRSSLGLQRFGAPVFGFLFTRCWPRADSARARVSGSVSLDSLGAYADFFCHSNFLSAHSFGLAHAAGFWSGSRHQIEYLLFATLVIFCPENPTHELKPLGARSDFFALDVAPTVGSQYSHHQHYCLICFGVCLVLFGHSL
jgi:hypothetical protein